MVAEKPIFHFFGIKFNFSRIKSATKFRYVKTSSSKVVEQSMSYEIKNIKYKKYQIILDGKCFLPREILA